MIPFRVAYIGSRNYAHFEVVFASLLKLSLWGEAQGRPVLIVSGTKPPPFGAKRNRADGVDEFALRIAPHLGMSTQVYPADYSKWGEYAPLKRNPQIVDGSDQVVAFWDQKSKGTAHALRDAIGKGKLGRVYGCVGFPLAPEILEGQVRRILASGRPIPL